MSPSSFAPQELIIQIGRSHTTTGSYDAIRLRIGDVCFSRAICSSRDIRQAKTIADQHQAEFWATLGALEERRL
jgi:hypothetical protein